MKKVFSIVICCVLSLSIVFYFLQAIPETGDTDVEILRVYNWEEYIAQEDEESGTTDVISGFENYCKETLGKNVKVEYSTFGTNENMYNELNMSKKTVNGNVSYSYDLVCPSEYMIMKMMRENMLEPLDKSGVSNYTDNASSYIQNLFQNLKVEDKTVSDYATCYMWGTMGFVYNPEVVSEEDANDWSLVWNPKYKGTSTIKDSVRDSYVLAVGYVYQEQLLALSNQYKSGEIDATTYNSKITEIFNCTDSEAISTVGTALTDLKNNIYGYEVDSGKKDIAQGKILINFAWSGDAVFTMDTAEGFYDDISEDEKIYLNWAVPTAGSNIWFDGWVMPKGANKELAEQFINYMSTPETAINNMSYIGYTSSIAGEKMFENTVNNYGYAGDSFDVALEGVSVSTDENGATIYSYFEPCDKETALSDGETEICDTTYTTKVLNGEKTYFVKEDYYRLNEEGTAFGEVELGEEFEVFPVDLGYFFGDMENYSSTTIFTAELGRQFSCQYPDLDTVNRCTVMKSFTDAETKSLNDMWQTAKIGRISPWSIAIPVLIIALIFGLAIALPILDKKGLIFQPKAPKGYVLTKIEFNDKI